MTELIKSDNTQVILNLQAQLAESIAYIKKLENLKVSVQAVIYRWNSPVWKVVEPTGNCIYAMRDSLESATQPTNLDKLLGETK